MERPVRVRFAPSYGPLHIGGVRTALYNYLSRVARRYDDSSYRRYRLAAFRAGCEEYILESLKWCGIEIDEGVGVGGPHAPYRQSERRDIYLKIRENSSWSPDGPTTLFDTAEELDALRKEYEARGENFRIQLFDPRETAYVALSLERGGRSPHRAGRPVGHSLQDARKRDRRNGRPDPGACRGEHFDARRQGAL